MHCMPKSRVNFHPSSALTWITKTIHILNSLQMIWSATSADENFYIIWIKKSTQTVDTSGVFTSSKV